MATRFRSTATWAGAVLVAALIPAVTTGGAAQAAEGCTSEVAPTADPLPLPTGPGCDDTSPPETSIDSLSPSPNAADWIRTDHMAFTFSGAYADADADVIAYECQFFNTPTPPADWSPCTSPATYEGLDETPTTPYTFRVRAVDSGDDGIDLTADPFFPSETDQPDYDPTPAEQLVGVDTKTPSAFIFKGPYDGEGTSSPIASRPRVTYTVDSSEQDVAYRCLLDGKPVACDQGDVTIGGLTGGDKVFQVKVTDRAGNVSGFATKQFTVPYDLRSATSWKRVRAKGSFAGDLLQTRQKGARIKFRAHNIREFRFLAPAGTELGKVRVLVDQGWKTFNLAKARPSRSRSYVVRDETSPLFSGPIIIESLSSGKPVRIDALVFPPGR